MDSLSLMTLLLAIATFILAGIASGAIWQNRSLQIRERKERLLNEVIDWAEDISKWYFPQDPTLLAVSSAIGKKTWIDAEIYNCFLSLRSLHVKAEYISRISEIFSQELVEAVNITMLALETHLGIISRMSSQIEGEEGKVTKDEISNSLTELHSSANKLIKEATEIKTRDIG